MSSDVVHQVRIDDASRTLGDGFLVAPGFVITTEAVVRGVGPGVSLTVRDLLNGPFNGPGSLNGAGLLDGPGGNGAEGSGIGDAGVAAPVAAEVVEVLGSDGLALLEVAPGFVVPARPIPAATLSFSFPAGTLADQLLRFRRFGAAYLRAALEGRPHAALEGRKMGGAGAAGGEGSTAETASERAGGTQRTTNTAGERGALLLAYLKERARSGRLDPLVTVPVLEGSR